MKAINNIFVKVMETINEPDGPNEEEITIEDIKTDVENIEVECQKINCNPVMNVISGIYKLICHLLKCFKCKTE